MWNFSVYDGLWNSSVYWQGFFALNRALNTGFFFGLQSELCVGFEFHLVSTCSTFKITLCSSPLKTCLQSARTFLNLIAPANPCFSFILIMQCCHTPHQRALLIKSCALYLHKQSCQTGQLCPSSILQSILASVQHNIEECGKFRQSKELAES